MKRWKDCNRLTKVARWIRHRPWSIVGFAADVAKWIVCGRKPIDLKWPSGHAKTFTTRDMIAHLWTRRASLAHVRMGAYLTTDEYLAELRETAK